MQLSFEGICLKASTVFAMLLCLALCAGGGGGFLGHMIQQVCRAEIVNRDLYLPSSALIVSTELGGTANSSLMLYCDIESLKLCMQARQQCMPSNDD